MWPIECTQGGNPLIREWRTIGMTHQEGNRTSMHTLLIMGENGTPQFSQNFAAIPPKKTVIAPGIFADQWCRKTFFFRGKGTVDSGGRTSPHLILPNPRFLMLPGAWERVERLWFPCRWPNVKQKEKPAFVSYTTPLIASDWLCWDI